MVLFSKHRLLASSFFFLAATSAYASPPVASPLIAGAVDDTAVTALPGDLPGALERTSDTGSLAAGTALPHIRLALKRPAALQSALDQLVHDQQDKSRADYHHWLTADQLRAYGPAQADIDRVTAWLTRRGLTVNSVSRSGMEIDFGGSATAVAAAFHTSMHSVALGKVAHISNMTAPAVPAALMPVVAGVTLHNFFPTPAVRRTTPSFTAPTPFGTFYAVAPADFATIYNLNPMLNGTSAFGHRIAGAGVTIALVEQTKILDADVQTFRSTFGLSGYAGTLTQINPGGCKPAGFIADEGEAALDAEWAGATAPDATLLEAECATVAPLYFGVETALQNLVEGGTTATVFSISYQGDERDNGFSFQQGWSNLMEEAAAEGISVFVASGDGGVSRNEGGFSSTGLFVNGLSDTQYATSVGGTDFLDTALGQNKLYWKNKNTATGQSARSYIPETPWNNSCASFVLAKVVGAASPVQFCGSNPTYGQPGVGGSGSQSVYYTKPAWQLTTIPGMPNDDRRDQPDVSLFAANGIFGHFYLFCMSDPNEGGAPCDYKKVNDLFDNAAGGTSFASPAFAGIAALVQQAAIFEIGKPYRPGNFAPLLYKLANAQYATKLGLSPCNSSFGNKVSTACAFYDVTIGNIAEPCVAGTPDCKVGPGVTNGVGILQNPAVTARFAYPAQTGYSLATGLGTVNVSNLVFGLTP